ncbi:hypothetical protein CEXT_245971 [Caerostris extrusa]|uniref:Uncharacterized protein n=1 Tax=Caerostris extrusa TaxID=172846 RepID=A0AAV4NN74_CAEEX|nr:hypothetical protein CEXT_245971 [Caerostris extrusa]
MFTFLSKVRPECSSTSPNISDCPSTSHHASKERPSFRQSRRFLLPVLRRLDSFGQAGTLRCLRNESFKNVLLGEGEGCSYFFCSCLLQRENVFVLPKAHFV